MDKEKKAEQVKAFAKAYRVARARKGWSHTEAGRRLGVSEAASRMYEHGRRTPSVPVFLAMIGEFHPEDAVQLLPAFGMTTEGLHEIMRIAQGV